jgi:hypothetical protein
VNRENSYIYTYLYTDIVVAVQCHNLHTIHPTLSTITTNTSTMPFRARLKKTFSRSSASSSSSGSSLSKTDSNLYYQPGEKMPLKYKRPVEKAHKEKLEAFQFEGAWRRKSFQSVYSPMGSRMPSRKNSVEFLTTRSNMGPRELSHLAGQEMADASDDSDENNLSSSPSSSTISESMGDEIEYLSANSIRVFADPHHVPFSQEDLSMALKRSHLTDRSS